MDNEQKNKKSTDASASMATAAAFADDDDAPNANDLFGGVLGSYFDHYTDAMRFRTALYFLHISKVRSTKKLASRPSCPF